MVKSSRKSYLEYPRIEFNLNELVGAVGNYGTIIPILLGVAFIMGTNFGTMLFFFGICYMLIGLYYKLPISVEPMKVIGVLVIAGGISDGELVASGIIIGIFFLVLGFGKGMKFIQKKVPISVIRGIQLGLALLLIKTSINFIIEDLIFAGFSILIIFLFFIANKIKKVTDVSALIIFLIGIIAGLYLMGLPGFNFITITKVIIPNFQEFITSSWVLVIPQIPMTIANAILAVSLLVQDLFQKELDPDRLSKTIGAMNLATVPFGGFPLCHGAGGLAAQYRFGARTGGANILSGLMLIMIAFFLASPEFINMIPIGIFGALLVFVALELGRHGIKTDSYPLTITIAIICLLINIAIAFIVGLIIAYLLIRFKSSNPSK